MSYQKLPFTWGSKTVAEMQLLDAKPGDTVWNLDWNIMETCVYEQNYDEDAILSNPGPVWVNDQSYILTCSGYINKGTSLKVFQSNYGKNYMGGDFDEFAGIAIRGINSDNDLLCYVQVAFMGKWEVLWSDEVSLGDYGQLAGSSVVSSGFGTDGVVCQTLEEASNGPGNTVLAWSAIQTVEYV